MDRFSNAATTTLNGGINNSVTSITVTSATGFPSAAPFRIRLVAEGGNTDEICTVTAGAGTTSWTVTRASEAYGGTQSASSHGNGATVEHVLTADSLKSIVWPADLTPSSPSASDDEFDITDTSDPMAGWTTLGTPTAHNINSTVKSHYYVSRAQSGSARDWCGIYKVPPTAPFTVTTKLSDMYGRDAFNSAGLLIGETTPGAFYSWGIRYQGILSWRLELDLWTGPTGTGSSVGSTTAANIPLILPIYLRATVNSNDDVDFYYSSTGLLWTPCFLDINPAFSVGSVGLIAESEDSTYNGEGLFDWIRFT